MSLIKCPECAEEVSSRARACPHCGSPLRGETIVDPAFHGKGEGVFLKSLNCGCIAVLGLVGLVVLLIVIGATRKPDYVKVVDVAALEASLTKPPPDSILQRRPQLREVLPQGRAYLDTTTVRKRGGDVYRVSIWRIGVLSDTLREDEVLDIDCLSFREHSIRFGGKPVPGSGWESASGGSARRAMLDLVCSIAPRHAR